MALLTLSLIPCRIFSLSSSILRCFSLRLSSASFNTSNRSCSAWSSASLSPPPSDSPPNCPIQMRNNNTNHQYKVHYTFNKYISRRLSTAAATAKCGWCHFICKMQPRHLVPYLIPFKGPFVISPMSNGAAGDRLQNDQIVQTHCSRY